MLRTRVALCVIADEVLSGKTLDTNSNYLAKRAFESGLELAEVRTIPDRPPVIINTVQSMSTLFDIVLTTGGVGPTHDDRTYAAIGEAFNRLLTLDDRVAERMRHIKHISTLNAGQLRMCTLPSPDTIIFTEGLWQPIVQVANVFVFPGVPGLFHRMLDHWLQAIVRSDPVKYKLVPQQRIGLKTRLPESEISATLGGFEERAHAFGWNIGSYPKLDLDTGDAWVELSLVGPSLDDDSMLRMLIADMKSAYNADDYSK